MPNIHMYATSAVSMPLPLSLPMTPTHQRPFIPAYTHRISQP